MTSDQIAAMFEIRLNINRLYSNLIGLENSMDWDSEKIKAAMTVLGIVEKLIDSAKDE